MQAFVSNSSDYVSTNIVKCVSDSFWCLFYVEFFSLSFVTTSDYISGSFCCRLRVLHLGFPESAALQTLPSRSVGF